MIFFPVVELTCKSLSLAAIRESFIWWMTKRKDYCFLYWCVKRFFWLLLEAEVATVSKLPCKIWRFFKFFFTPDALSDTTRARILKLRITSSQHKSPSYRSPEPGHVHGDAYNTGHEEQCSDISSSWISLNIQIFILAKLLQVCCWGHSTPWW